MHFKIQSYLHNKNNEKNKEKCTVFDGSLGIMDGAGSDNDEETVITALDDLLGSLASEDNGLGSSEREGQVLHEDLRGDQRLDLLDALVIELVQGYLVLSLKKEGGVRIVCTLCPSTTSCSFSYFFDDSIVRS